MRQVLIILALLVSYTIAQPTPSNTCAISVSPTKNYVTLGTAPTITSLIAGVAGTTMVFAPGSTTSISFAPSAGPGSTFTVGSASINLGTTQTGAQSVTIGTTGPTLAAANVYVAQYSNTAELGQNARYIDIGKGSYVGASDIIIGRVTARPSPSPVPTPNTQTIQVGRNSDGLFLGEHATNIYIGTPNPVAPTPASQNVAIGSDSAAVYVGHRAANTIISNGATTATLSLGFRGAAPTYSQSKINMLGLYHYYYQAGCLKAASGATAVLCTSSVVTNGGTYSTDKYYVPEVGTYSVSVSLLSLNDGSTTPIEILVYQGSTIVTQLYSDRGTGQYIRVSGTVLMKFNTATGSGLDYIYIVGSGSCTALINSASYNTLAITRVA